MWENFKTWVLDWVASDNFVWFMIGWMGSEFLNNPSLISLFIIAFWVWVLMSQDE